MAWRTRWANLRLTECRSKDNSEAIGQEKNWEALRTLSFRCFTSRDTLQKECGVRSLILSSVPTVRTSGSSLGSLGLLSSRWVAVRTERAGDLLCFCHAKPLSIVFNIIQITNKITAR